MSTVETRGIESIHGLSPLQRGMLFHTLYERGTGAYIQQVTAELVGELEAEEFRAAWGAVLERHPVLRSAVVWEKIDQPVLVVQRSVELPLRWLDWTELDEATREARFGELLEEDRGEGFELTRAPLMRLVVIREGEGRHRLLWTYHHLLLDGWSLALVLKELFACFEGIRLNRPPALGASRPFRDYITWLKRQDAAAAESFWRARLAGFGEPTSLGVDYDRDLRNQGASYRELRGTLDAEATRALQETAQRAQLTLSILVQGAWALLLARYGGRDDVVFGTTVSGRPADLPGVERMVGLFINTLPTRVRVTPGAPVAEWLRGLQREQAEARQFEYSALSEVQALSEVPAGVPLFETIVVFENYPIDAATDLSGGPLRVEGLRYVEQTHYPLTLLAVPGRELSLGLAYDTRRFDEATVERMLGHLHTILHEMARAPEREVGAVGMLSAAERALAVLPAPVPEEAPPCAHELFERWAARRPGATAVVSGGAELTYDELNRQANRLAHRLIALGVRNEDRVAICLERSPRLAAALLGVLKSGAAYVPLDPTDPAERLRAVMDAARPVAVVVDGESRDVLEGVAGAPLVQLDALEWESTANPARPVDAESLAYVLYTSGSTGTPKGVMVPHRALVRYTLAMIGELGLAAGDRVLEFAPITFDASVVQIFPALLGGAALCIQRDVARLSNMELLRLVEESRVSVLDLPAAFWQQWVDDLAAQGIRLRRPLRFFLTGGESIFREKLRAWAAVAPPASGFLTSYGPTEATVAATVFTTDSDAAAALPFERVPLGRPLEHAGVYLLDAALRPVPPGVTGYLHLGGDGVSRGYLDDPRQTAGRFLPDPFAGRPGARMFATGDLARLLADGRMEFRGREDVQVKVRGFRIELAEIETALARHPDLRGAVVTVHERAGGKELVAYVVANASAPPDAAALRAYLGERLPAYMVPAFVVPLAQLPATRNGKIDRDALPAPVFGAGEAEGAAPLTEIERVLAEIWAGVLEVERVGRHDDFFALGGHSLTATQLVSRIRAWFKVELPLASIFEHPTLAASAAQVEAALGRGGAAHDPIRPTEGDTAPLSLSQQRLWFLDQLNPGEGVYNLPVLLRLTGRLDAAALERSFHALVSRHESLRTTFGQDEAGAPVQKIHPPAPVLLPVTDLSEMEQGVDELAREEGRLPFDLERGPLFRARLVRLSPDEHVLLVTMHHIVSDGWSMGILIREVAALYQAEVDGVDAALPPLPVQYRDFARWQREGVAGGRLRAPAEYWREKLADPPGALSLPTDRPRPARQGFVGARERVVLSPELTHSLRELGRKERATLFMVILSAFKLLLFRYSGEADLVVGSPVANRTQQSTEGLIGFFLNTLALRTRVAGGWSFRRLLESVRETTLGAYTHQDLPFEQLLELLQPGRELSATPLFQVMFNMQNFAESRVEVPGLAMESVEPKEDWAKFDLTLFAEESGGRLRLEMVYGTELFDAGTVRQMLEHLERVLRTVAENPAVGLSDLPLLPPAAAAPPPAIRFPAEEVEGTVDERFRRQVEAGPDRLAVRDGARAWSYARLDAGANQLAHRILAAGDGPVALLLPHGAAQGAGMLAALRCGRMYVPLDPAYPVRRLEHMLRDSGCRTLVAAPGQAALAAELAGGGLRVLEFDADAEPAPTPPVRGLSTPSSHAYILYTSGSTGEPKGALQSQRNLLHHIRCYTNNLELRADDRLLQVASYSFDAAVMDVYGAFLNGASLFPYDVRGQGVEALGAFLRAERISIYHSTPTVYRYFLDASPAGEGFAHVRRVVLGGEEVVPRDVERFHERFADGCVFVNGFGPTESTLTLQFPVAKGSAPTGSRVPIGYPVQETGVVLLDDDGGEIADVGVGGLAIRSRYLVLGYWNSPERNEAAFTPDPADPELRTYRTGDIGRRRFDGAFEYLGRADAQVKVRGFRVEVAEVEAVLARHPGVREAVVVALPDARGETRLVAYAVPRGELPPEAELRRHLAERLPDYMVPSHFVEMESFPLTPTGKVHRRELPPPPERAAAGAARRDFRDPVEEMVAATWSEVLRRDDVGPDDDFFALGGHSLLATQVMSRLQQRFAVDLPLRTLFEAPTVAGLADAVRGARGAAAAPRIGRVTRRTGLPLSFAQQRLWFMDRVDPGNPAYIVPAAVELKGPLDPDALRRSLDEVVRRHEVLRMTFADGPEGPVQTPAPVLEVPVPVVDLTSLPAEERRERALQMALDDAGEPFDLAAGPLLRARLLRLGHDDHLLLLSLHHIVCDGWSMGVLVSELAGAYGAFSRGLPSPLPELGIQYADFAHWQRGYLTGEVLETQLGYWRGQLGEPPAPLRLAQREPEARTNRGERLTFQVPDEVAAALKRITREHGATLYMTLLAAYQTLIARVTGRDDFVVGTAIANRNRREVEPLIGFFVNMLPLRSDLSGQPRFSEVVERARKVTLDAYAHQDVPFERLVRELEPRRSLDRSPLFQIFFGMLDMPEPAYELGGLSLNRLDLEYGFARFDLSLFMAERGGKLEGTWLYSPDLYDEARIGEMAEAFGRLLAAAAHDPEQPIAGYELFPPRQPARSRAAEKLRTARRRRSE